METGSRSSRWWTVDNGKLEYRRKAFLSVDLYPVIGERFCAGRPSVEVLNGVIAGGARIVQFREKDFPEREIFRRAEQYRRITADAGILLVINDRVDIALAVDADGVHLGQEDIPVEAARAIAPDLLLGVSTHSLEEAVAAQERGADYVNVGPIFPTSTKQGLQNFLGPEAVNAIGEKIDVPYTVMGGIRESNLDEVLRRGARRVALVTAVTQAPDIVEATRSLVRRISGYKDVTG
jgi:thiamine-phosphate pyrophosphorylase